MLDFVIRLVSCMIELGRETLSNDFRGQLRAGMLALVAQKYYLLFSDKDASTSEAEAVVKTFRKLVQSLAGRWQAESEEMCLPLDMRVWAAVVEAEATLLQIKDARKVTVLELPKVSPFIQTFDMTTDMQSGTASIARGNSLSVE